MVMETQFHNVQQSSIAENVGDFIIFSVITGPRCDSYGTYSQTCIHQEILPLGCRQEKNDVVKVTVICLSYHC